MASSTCSPSPTASSELVPASANSASVQTSYTRVLLTPVGDGYSQSKTTVRRPWTRTRCSTWRADGTGEHDHLEVASAAPEIVDRVAVADAHDVLVDDRAVVELGGCVVRGDTDESSHRVRAPGGRAGRRMNAGRNEWWMLMIALRPPRDEFGAQDLHVAGEHHQRHPVVFERLLHRSLLLGLRARRDREMARSRCRTSPRLRRGRRGC